MSSAGRAVAVRLLAKYARCLEQAIVREGPRGAQQLSSATRSATGYWGDEAAG